MILVKKVNNVWQRWSGDSNLDLAKVQSLINNNVWTSNDYEKFGLKIAVPFSVPENKVITGNESFVEANNVVSQVYSVIDVPGPTVQQLKDYSAEKRRIIINGSASVNVGTRTIPVWVDPESRSSITGLVVASSMVPNLTVDWKGSDGNFYQLSNTEVVTLALGVMGHIKGAFDIESNVSVMISSNTINSYAQINTKYGL